MNKFKLFVTRKAWLLMALAFMAVPSFAQDTDTKVLMDTVNDGMSGLKAFAIGLGVIAVGVAIVWAVTRNAKKGTKVV